jgi:protease PrsW
VTHAALALLPVLAFLATLVLLDSFKLVRLRSVLQAIALGALAALAATELHRWLLDATDLPVASFSRYVAPFSEELLKAAYVVFLLERRRVGFLVDAVISGFAVGAGFALVENVEYLRALAGASSLLWFVRGLGTALLHGATTAILAMLAKSLGDRYPERRALAFVPGFAAAVGIHSLFNHALVSPLLASLLLLVAIPAAVFVIFERSEAATREWLGAGLDLDLDLLRLILSGVFPHTRLGAYLESLKARFPGVVVADMFCLLRVELELSIRAKGMLMAREAGFDVPVGADLEANLAELKYLEKSIGRTGLLALKPLHVTGSLDLWHHYLLEQGGRAGNAARG